jgi:hypothetical protein
MPPESSKNKRVAILAGAVLVLMLVWGVLLPSIAAWPRFQMARQRFEESGVNPSAFFYTDHPRMMEVRFRAGKVDD